MSEPSNNSTAISTTPSTTSPTVITSPTTSDGPTTSPTTTTPTTSDVSTPTTPSTSSSSSPTSISSSSPTTSPSFISTSTPTTSLTPTPTVRTSTTVVSQSNGQPPSTIVVSITTTNSPSPTSNTATAAATSSTPSASAVGSAGSQNGSSSSPSPSIVAPAVIVPVIGIALIVVLGIFLWRRRKQRLEAAEMRQKEMEEYSYNPNSDPTIPAVGAVASSGDDQSGEGGGYRGWGTTSSAGPRKASTTLGSSTLGGTSNPGAIGIARSDSGGRGYDDHSPHAISTEGNEGIASLGTGPLAGNRKGQGVNRGVSNASSAYSGGQRSDGSDNAPVGFAGSPQQYYDDIMQPDEGAHDGYGQPVIRDVSARRNTRIENPAIYPQHGNAGIAQNF